MSDAKHRHNNNQGTPPEDETSTGFNKNRRNFLRMGAAAAVTTGAAAVVGPTSALAASKSSSGDKLPPLGQIPKYHDYGQGKKGMDAAKLWVEDFFQPSTLTQDQQLKEMQFFVDAAKPYQGMSISVACETTGNHRFEANILSKAFEQITGIHVDHNLMDEGQVVNNLQTEMATGQDVYDIFMNDSDFIDRKS